MKDLLLLMRPHQWIKNTFVLAALIFSGRLFEAPYFGRAVTAFVVFCILSSGVYTVNDILDRETDRSHPRKRSRPLASGSVRPSTAWSLAAVLLVSGVAGAFALGMPVGLCAAAYLVLQAGYNFSLRRLVLLDVFCIALGFVLRAMAGAAAISVAISPWLILCTLLVALFLGFSKRRNEIVVLGHGAESHRTILHQYSLPFLDQLIGIVTAATIVAYSIYTLSPEVTVRFGIHYMILTLPFVLYGIFRYLFLVHMREKGGSPTKDFLEDAPLLVSVCLWAAASVAIIYRF